MINKELMTLPIDRETIIELYKLDPINPNFEKKLSDINKALLQ